MRSRISSGLFTTSSGDVMVLVRSEVVDEGSVVGVMVFCSLANRSSRSLRPEASTNSSPSSGSSSLFLCSRRGDIGVSCVLRSSRGVLSAASLSSYGSPSIVSLIFSHCLARGELSERSALNGISSLE